MNKTGKTGFLYTTKNGEFKEKQEFFVEFDDFLNEGTYRECYLGQYLNEDKEEIPDDVYGTGDCVVKIPKKNSYNLNYTEYSSLEDSYSTTIAQFPNEDNGYIISIIKTDLYIFDKNGNYQEMARNLSFITTTKIHSIITFSKQDNNYYFYIIYGNDGNNQFSELIFIKCTYNIWRIFS